MTILKLLTQLKQVLYCTILFSISISVHAQSNQLPGNNDPEPDPNPDVPMPPAFEFNYVEVNQMKVCGEKTALIGSEDLADSQYPYTTLAPWWITQLPASLGWEQDWPYNEDYHVMTYWGRSSSVIGQVDEHTRNLAFGRKAAWMGNQGIKADDNNVYNDATQTSISTPVTSSSLNWIEQGNNLWFVFKLPTPPQMTSSSATSSDLSDNYCELYLTDDSESEGLKIKIEPKFGPVGGLGGLNQYIGTVSYDLYFEEISNPGFYNHQLIDVASGKYVYISILGSNGQTRITLDGALHINHDPSDIDMYVSQNTQKRFVFKSYTDEPDFRLGVEDLISSIPCDEPSYYPLANDLDGGFYNTLGSFLYFKYDGEYNKGKLDFIIKDEAGQDVTNDTSIDNELKEYGDNRFHLNAADLDDGYYTLQITNEKAEKYYLRFYKKY